MAGPLRVEHALVPSVPDLAGLATDAELRYSTDAESGIRASPCGTGDLKVVMLVSEHPYSEFNPDRPLPDARAADAFFAPRDPTGVLRRQLEANGALADGNLDLAEAQGLLFSVLEAQGNPVSLDVLPGSTHISLSAEGWKVFLAAFPKAATQD